MLVLLIFLRATRMERGKEGLPYGAGQAVLGSPRRRVKVNSGRPGAESAPKGHHVVPPSTPSTAVPPTGGSPPSLPQPHQEHRSSGSAAGPGLELSLGGQMDLGAL